MKRRWVYRLGLFLVDVILLEAAFFGVYWWRFHTGLFVNPITFSLTELFVPSLIVAAYWGLLFAWFGLYRFDPLQPRTIAFRNSVKAAAFGALILFILTFDPNQPLPRTRVVLASYGIALMLIASGNRILLLTLLRALRIRGVTSWRTLLVGDGARAQALLRHIRLHPELGWRIVAELRSSPSGRSDEQNATLKSSLSRFREILRSRSIDVVLFALEDQDLRRLFRLVRLLRESSARSFVAADQYPALIGQVRPARVYGHPLIEVRPELLSPVERFFKRLTDIVLGGMLLVASLPIWIVLAVAIPLDSPGPILYSQRRVGRKGRVFTLYKFRSMRRDAEARTGAVLASERDPRITRVGRIIRPLRLDELPQLINVLVGRMSLVGPRPERMEFVERFVREVPLYERRLNVKPGITGWSQVHLKYDSGADHIPAKLNYDFWYIENMSLPLDMKILLMTLFVMLRGEGR